MTGDDVVLLRSSVLKSSAAMKAQLLAMAMSFTVPLFSVTVRMSDGCTGSVMLRMTSLLLPLPELLETSRREASFASTRARNAASAVQVLFGICEAVGVLTVSVPAVMTGDSSG